MWSHRTVKEAKAVNSTLTDVFQPDVSYFNVRIEYIFDRYHVIWNAVHTGKAFETQQEAVDYANRLLKKLRDELVEGLTPQTDVV